MIGAHVSSAGGASEAPKNAHKEALECFQFFSRPPQGGKAPELTPEIVQLFKKRCKQWKFRSYIHAPYFINLASTNNRIYYGSISVLKEELARANRLGVTAMMTHIGTANGQDRVSAIQRASEALKKILDGYSGNAWFLLEISAGAGEVIGDTFEEIAQLIHTVKHPRLGVCLDTCHAFASGYDLRTPESVDAAVQKFDAIVGLELLKVLHLNDSKGEFNGRLDRHAHIGEGKIGKTGIFAILHHPKLRKFDVILETPLSGRFQDVKILKQLRNSHGA